MTEPCGAARELGGLDVLVTVAGGMVAFAPPAPPHEVTDAAVFLASPLSSNVTGQSLVIDGGVTVRDPS